MALQHLSARSRAQSPVRRPAARSGVVHVNVRHTSRCTVVGNHLAQHRELSLIAIGLAVHIQSLKAGSEVTIKCFTARFPESEARIAEAMRELEAAGYLARPCERLANGRLVTRTISYNRPGASPAPHPPEPKPERVPVAVAVPGPPPNPKPVPVAPPEPPPEPEPAPRRASPPLPSPQSDDLTLHGTAVALLTDLRRDHPRLLLSEPDVRRLAPAVEAWLERDTTPEAVRRTLTANLPPDLSHPAGLLAHRLTALLPPPLPAAPVIVRPDPLQTCDTCDRAFRAPEPGHCRDCRPDTGEAATPVRQWGAEGPR
ncbi:helix-turn-helix domain-containing protein [Streptomyces sp. NPDC054841]